MMSEKDRNRLFLLIQRKIKKLAKNNLEEEHCIIVCDFADDEIEYTRISEGRDNEDCYWSLEILEELKNLTKK